MITITESAKRALLTYAKAHGVPAIRFSVGTTGCSGFQYLLDPQETIDPELSSMDLGENIKLLLSNAHSILVDGTVIDYVSSGLNRKFIYTNPNIKDWCGCGESFRVNSV